MRTPAERVEQLQCWLRMLDSAGSKIVEAELRRQMNHALNEAIVERGREDTRREGT